MPLRESFLNTEYMVIRVGLNDSIKLNTNNIIPVKILPSVQILHTNKIPFKQRTVVYCSSCILCICFLITYYSGMLKMHTSYKQLFVEELELCPLGCTSVSNSYSVCLLFHFTHIQLLEAVVLSFLQHQTLCLTCL